MLRVLHSSDLHGAYKSLLNGAHEFDLWLDTGDFFTNIGRAPRTDYKINAGLERARQLDWWRWKDLGTRFTRWLAGRPAVIVSGNHDFADLASLLRRSGADAHAVNPEGVHIAGLTWAGFREVLFIDGEWPGEVTAQAFEPLVERTWAARPDVLTTHSPPAGILNGRGGEYGVVALLEKLRSGGGPRWHFFGHDHLNGGQQAACFGVHFFNGACNALVHEIPSRGHGS